MQKVRKPTRFRAFFAVENFLINSGFPVLTAQFPAQLLPSRVQASRLLHSANLNCQHLMLLRQNFALPG